MLYYDEYFVPMSKMLFSFSLVASRSEWSLGIVGKKNVMYLKRGNSQRMVGVMCFASVALSFRTVPCFCRTCKWKVCGWRRFVEAARDDDVAIDG